MSDVPPALLSSESNERYTPPYIIEAARSVLSPITLDPATCATAQEWIKADTFYTAADDGLKQDWWARAVEVCTCGCGDLRDMLVSSNVWLNPPYGRIGGKSSAGVWIEKLVSETDAGRVSAAIALLPASINDMWFQALWEPPFTALCFPNHRIRFWDETGKPLNRPARPNVLAYIGKEPTMFQAVFEDYIGPVMVRQAGEKTWKYR